MLLFKVKQAAYRTCTAFLLTSTVVLALSATTAVAQPNAFEQLTKENLIGKSVSLSNESYDEIDKAIQRFRNGDAEGALEFLKTAKDKYPKLPPVDVLYAKMHFAVRNANAIKLGLNFLERSVTNNPEDPEAYLIFADQAFKGRRVTEAQALFQMVDPLVQKFEGNTKRKQDFMVRLLAGHAAVAESRQKWDEAQKWLEQWVEIAPESAPAHQRLGSTLFQNDKPREAFEMFTKARDLNDEVQHPYVALALLFSRDGDVEKAQKAFEKAYAEDKNDPKTSRAYAEWLIQQGQLDQAQSIAKSLLTQDPNSITALLLDGIVAQMKGDTDHAKQAMTKIISLDPSHYTATDLLAQILIKGNDVADHERALKYANMNSRNYPNSPAANITRAWILHQLGRTAEFQAALQKVGRTNVPLDAAFLIAKIMVEQDKKDNAIREIDRLLKIKSGLFIFRHEAEELLNTLKSE